MGADRNKHRGTERRQRWLGSATAWGHGGAMDKSGSSFGKVHLETFLPWMPCGASVGDCGEWIFLQAQTPSEGSLAQECPSILCPGPGSDTKS